jgi:peptide/nickel transport system substrate-binding protein
VEAELRAAIVVLLAVASVAHAETRPHYGGTVEGTLLGAPGTLDPTAAQSHAEITVVGLMFDTLYQLGPDGAASPHLAAALPALDDKRTTARIAIRHGVRFQGGAELTAADVAASLDRLRTTSARWAIAAVTSVRADGDLVELTLRAPVPELASLLALPQTAITRAGKPPGDHPDGSGPFALESLDRGKRVLVLRAYDGHFAGRPYLDRVVLRWYDTPDGEARRFETGAAQLSARGVGAFANSQPIYRADDVQGPASLLVYVGFGRAHADVTGERAFRRALDRALARASVVNISSGELVTAVRTPLPMEAGGSALDAASLAGDLDAARAALVDAAKHVPALTPAKIGGLHLEILVEDTRPDDRDVAERVLRALDKLGIAATITSVPAPTLRERIAKGTADLWIGQLAAPVGLADAWWGAAFAAGGDDWAQQHLSDGHLDPAAARKAFADRLPIVPLFVRAVRLWHRTDVRGVAFDASGRPCLADLFLYGEPARTKAGT